MTKNLAFVFGLGAIGVCPAVLPAAVVSDDFDDNVRGAYWSQVEDDPADLSVTETSQRLESRSTGFTAPTDDAIYLSDAPGGFVVSTASDFEAQIDYALLDTSGASPFGASFALDFGMGNDADGRDSLSIVYGVSVPPGPGTPVTALGYAYRVNDVQTGGVQFGSFPTGVFYISYDASLDTVYLSNAGYGAANADFTLPGLVRGTWGAEHLLVGFGFRGAGLATGAGDAYFDNFQIVAGDVVFPEPSSLCFAALIAFSLRHGRARRHPLPPQ